MNIQIFGTTKCFDTKKAQRYFKERGIRFQMIDLKEKEMSRGVPRSGRLAGAGKSQRQGQADPRSAGRAGGLAEGRQALREPAAVPHPHRPQWPSGHRRLPARRLEELGMNGFHQNNTGRVLHPAHDCGILFLSEK